VEACSPPLRSSNFSTVATLLLLPLLLPYNWLVKVIFVRQMLYKVSFWIPVFKLSLIFVVCF